MKLIVMSDSHGNFRIIDHIIQNFHADLYIHLGDGERELNTAYTMYLDKKFLHVAGNCDFASLSPDELLICPDNKTSVFAVHGHKYNVKYSLDKLKKTALSKYADIVLYGHTHSRFLEYDNGLYVMNPGSVSIPRDGKRPSFGIIDITFNGIVTNIVDL